MLAKSPSRWCYLGSSLQNWAVTGVCHVTQMQLESSMPLGDFTSNTCPERQVFWDLPFKTVPTSRSRLSRKSLGGVLFPCKESGARDALLSSSQCQPVGMGEPAWESARECQPALARRDLQTISCTGVIDIGEGMFLSSFLVLGTEPRMLHH